MSERCAAIVLAAGAGTRMSSDLPKPLHPVAGRAMVLRVLDALAGADADPVVVVVGHGAAQVCNEVRAHAPLPNRLIFATQPEQLGTGDAVRVGLDALSETLGNPPATSDTTASNTASDVLVLPGDTPLLRPQTLVELVAVRRREGAAASLLTARLDDPAGYGRVVYSDAGIAIVEQRDASLSQTRIDEINVGVYCFEIAHLRWTLPRLRRANAVGEYYLTDAVGHLTRGGQDIAVLPLRDPAEALGANDAAQLAACEAALAARK